CGWPRLLKVWENRDMFPLIRVLLTVPLVMIFTAPNPTFGAEASQEPAPKAKKRAVVLNGPGSFQGYTLISPMISKKSYLIDMAGNIVGTWEGAGTPALTAYLLPSGNLLRPAAGEVVIRANGGIFPKGRIQEFTWNSEVVWDFAFESNKDIGKRTYTH